jgi:membrane-bound serine protease (ClpP class)
MAPGTHIGAAHPVSAGGEKPDEVMAKKSAEDVAAYVRTLANGRQRNVDLAQQAVNDSRAFTEQEALTASPPLVDLLANDLSDLLTKLDGRSVRRFDGSVAVLRTEGAEVVPIEMTLRQRVLSAIANPNIAYLLLSLGMLGLTVELWSPGAVLPGVVGALSLLLAFFSLSLLPVNYAGLLLIVLGMVLLILEIKVTSYGVLTIGGAASLIFGSMILVDSSAPELQLNLRLILPVVAGIVAIAALLVRLAVSARHLRPITGEEGMIGTTGLSLTSLGPGSPGRVTTRGEIWQAVSDESIPERTPVRVVAVDGLTLSVRKE